MTARVRSRSRLLRTATVFLAAASLAACGSGASAGDSGGGGKSLTKVTFGATQPPSSIATVAAVLKQEGFARDCGVDLEFREFSPQDADVALLAGQTDIGYFGYNSWAASDEKLNKLAILAPLQAEHGTLFVPEDSPAKTLEDLKGKRIGLLAPVSGQYQDFNLLVSKMGFDLTKDFKVVTGPPPGVEAFLKRGQVDAAILFEPNSTKLMQAGGFRPIFSLNDKWESLTGDPLYMLGIAANRKWLSGNEGAAKCVVSAVHKATEKLANDPSVYKGIKDVLGAKTSEELDQLAKNLGKIYTPETAQQAAPAIRSQLEQAAKFGIIPEVPDQIFTPLGS